MSNILLIWGSGSLILCILCFVLAIVHLCSNNGIAGIIYLCFGVVFFLSLITFVIVATDRYNEPENQYERLLNNVDKANKELQKFYIDHPEFKENEE